MDRRTVLTKTAKGLMEVTGKTSLLPRDLRNVLSQVDGKATVGDLHQKLDKYTETKLLDTLGKLAKDGFVREFVSAPASISPPSQVPIVQEDLDLDFTALMSKPPNKAEVSAQTKAEFEDVARQVAQARVRQEADTKARADADDARARGEPDARAKAAAEARGRAEGEARAKREAEERARKEGEARAKAEAEARAKREADEKAKREAEERARKEGEARAKAEAEARAKREADEKAKREAEERARKEGEARAKAEAEARAKREADEKAKREAEERARKEGEARAKAEAEARAKREADEKAKREAEERARKEAEARAKAGAEARAKREADEKTKREAEEKAKREAEERTRKEADARAKADAEARAKREAEEKTRRDVEEKAKREADERGRREAEERARRESEERARREGEERVQQEQEERIRRELEDRVRQAEEQARREGEERAKRDAAARARRDAAERERREAEERAAREAEERSRREADERARREAAEESRREAEEAARRRDEEARAQREAEKQAREEDKARAKAEAEAAARARRDERAREKAEAEDRARENRKEEEKDAAQVAARLEKIRAGKSKSGGIGKVLGIGLVVLVVAGLVYLQFFMPLDIAQYERLASAQLGLPVKIRSGNISLLPTPSIRLENVTVGGDSNVKITVATAHPDFVSAIGGNPQLKSLDLEGVTLDAAGLAGVLFGRGKSTALGLERVHASGVKIVVPGVMLPELEATAALLPDGSVQKIVVNNSNKTIAAEILPQSGKAMVELSVAKPDALLGLPFAVETLSAKGVATASEFAASEFDARLLDGSTRGKGTLRWPGALAFDGNFELRQVDAKRVTPILVGRLHGTGVLAAQGESLEKLGPGARVDGNFTVSKGQITGVDLPRTLQSGKSVGGNTPFNEMTAQAQLDKGQLALRGLKIDAGALSANGAIDVDGGKSLSGRLAADLKTPGGVLRATLQVSGTPSQLAIKR